DLAPEVELAAADDARPDPGAQPVAQPGRHREGEIGALLAEPAVEELAGEPLEVGHARLLRGRDLARVASAARGDVGERALLVAVLADAEHLRPGDAVAEP